jgi:hypothetical protein
MSLIDKLPDTTLGPKKPSPLFTISSDKDSLLHNTSSINGNPVAFRKPSELDLDGKTPKGYKETAPKGARI